MGENVKREHFINMDSRAFFFKEKIKGTILLKFVFCMMKNHRSFFEYTIMKHILTTAIMAMAVLISLPLHAQSEIKRANKQYELSAYNLAIKSYRKVLEKESDNIEALSKIADCYRHLNQLQDAAAAYRRAIEKVGVDPIYLFQYANVLKASKDYEKAKEWFLIYGEGHPIYGNHFAESCDFAMSMEGVPPLYKVNNEFANSESSDFGPAFYGDQIVYSSSRRDITRATGAVENAWEGGAKNQLFISSLDQKGFLTKPSFLRSDLQNNYNEGPISFSADGGMVAFTKNNFVNGTRQIPSSGLELSIYIGEVGAGGNFENVKAFPFNGSGYSSGYPNLSADGRTMYFASNRPDGFGGFDIYVSYKTGSTWSTPENLGPVVNSQGDEITPAMVDDALYFSSNWHHGLGGFDIFRAEASEGVWKRVFHLGNEVNSARDDYGFNYNNEKNVGYFVSNRLGGKGAEDIYSVQKTTQNIVLSVIDAKGKQPLKGAIIDFSACGEPAFKTDARGQYSFQALEGLNCDVVVSKDGYKSFAFNLNSSSARANQTFDIILTSNADDYTGKIVNAANNASVEGVRIKAIDQTSGLVIETTSDAVGDYHLPLDPKIEYIIRYSKAGYLDTHNRVFTGNGVDRSVLGVISFVPSGTSLENGTVVSTAKPPGEKETKVITTPSKSSKPPVPPAFEEGSASTNGSGEVAFEMQKGYSVQIAAVAEGQKVKVGKYLKMDRLGNIYSRADKGFKKVRIGIFSTRAEAVTAQKEARESGYKSAFIVKERVESLTDLEVYSDVPVIGAEPTTAPTPVPAPVVEQPVPSPVVDNVPAISGEYKVRLASYKNPQYFKRSKVANIGTLEERKKGAYTIFLVAGFGTLDAAIKAKKEAVRSGFKGAHIVIEENGKLRKVM